MFNRQKGTNTVRHGPFPNMCLAVLMPQWDWNPFEIYQISFTIDALITRRKSLLFNTRVRNLCLKIAWAVQDKMLKTGWRLAENWLTINWRLAEYWLKTGWRPAEDHLKTSWRPTEDQLKTIWLTTGWRLTDGWLNTGWRLAEDWLKTGWRPAEPNKDQLRTGRGQEQLTSIWLSS